VQHHRHPQGAGRQVDVMQENPQEHGHRPLVRINVNGAEEKGGEEDSRNHAISADKTAAEKAPTPKLLTDPRPHADHHNPEPPRPSANHANHFLHVHIETEFFQSGKIVLGQQIRAISQHYHGGKTEQYQKELAPTGTAESEPTPPVASDHEAN